MLSASSALLAGCGGHAAAPPPAPHLPRADAAQLISLAAQVARDAPVDRCAARQEIAMLQSQADALLATGRVPVALRAPLRRGVASLVRAQPACAPPPAPVAVTPPKHGHKQKKSKHGKGD